MNTHSHSCLKGLNDQQRRAVLKTEGPLLVLAGAGTGKTRVVTCRIARLIACGVAPQNILAVTFTKKAATEMKERAEALLDRRSVGLTVCTFHALGYRLLAENDVRVGDDGRVNVLNAKVQRAIVSKVLATVDMDGWFDVDTALRAISRHKNGVAIDSRFTATDQREILVPIVTEYERVMDEQQMVDFDDLLSIPLRMLQQSRRLRNLYRRRWTYILIDEYQDTNDVQHALVQLLTGNERNLCVVGDDDQSIYGFRGATVERILGFESDFPGATRITLEQSYRSYREILSVANAVISRSTVRHHKLLQSLRGNGGIVTRMRTFDDEEESATIAEDIQKRKARPGTRWSDMAVLFRVQADSRLLRTALKARNIPCCSANPNSGGEDGVSIMTLHRSKGLEFQTVFLPAIEEDTLPHFHAMQNGTTGIEEERRLLYVGVTRAQKELVLSTCQQRRGRTRQVSRFLVEVGLS